MDAGQKAHRIDVVGVGAKRGTKRIRGTRFIAGAQQFERCGQRAAVAVELEKFRIGDVGVGTTPQCNEGLAELAVRAARARIEADRRAQAG